MAQKSWQKERYWKDDDTAPCSTQHNPDHTEKETLKEKFELSTRVVEKSIYLMEQVNKAIDMPQDPDVFPKMLSFLQKANEAITRFCNHFELCDRIQLKLDNTLSVKYQIIITVDEILYLLRLIKRCITVFQSVRNPPAQDICYRICKKLNFKFETYLVNIKYWVSQMSAEEKERYNLA